MNLPQIYANKVEIESGTYAIVHYFPAKGMKISEHPLQAFVFPEFHKG
jgi:hypothetical protein